MLKTIEQLNLWASEAGITEVVKKYNALCHLNLLFINYCLSFFKSHHYLILQSRMDVPLYALDILTVKLKRRLLYIFLQVELLKIFNILNDIL